MPRAKFVAVHPLLGTRDVRRAIEFYTTRLGFTLAFQDQQVSPNYIGLRRDAIELHVQFQFEHEMATARIRLKVDDPDALFAEYQAQGVIPAGKQVADTPWGTREFAIYDPDRNALAFYRDLRLEK